MKNRNCTFHSSILPSWNLHLSHHQCFCCNWVPIRNSARPSSPTRSKLLAKLLSKKPWKDHSHTIPNQILRFSSRPNCESKQKDSLMSQNKPEFQWKRFSDLEEFGLWLLESRRRRRSLRQRLKRFCQLNCCPGRRFPSWWWRVTKEGGKW